MKFLLNLHITIIQFLFLSTFLFSTTSVQAQIFDSYSLEYGTGLNSSMYRLAAQKMFAEDNRFLSQYYLHPYADFSIATINKEKYQNIQGQSKTIADFGITPVLRWQKNVNEGLFAEVGIGVNYMTDYYNNDKKKASTKFQFGDHIGVGYKFSNSLEITLKLQHFSNASIKRPNPAIDFALIKVAYSF